MKTYTLSFGTVTLLRPDLAEVIVSEGVEIDLEMVNEYHAFVTKHLADPCGTLINKKNHYSHTFAAQLAISNLAKIKAIAVVAYWDSAKVVTQTLMKLPTHAHWNLQIFPDREIALEWLKQQLFGKKQ